MHEYVVASKVNFYTKFVLLFSYNVPRASTEPAKKKVLLPFSAFT